MLVGNNFGKENMHYVILKCREEIRRCNNIDVFHTTLITHYNLMFARVVEELNIIESISARSS